MSETIVDVYSFLKVGQLVKMSVGPSDEIGGWALMRSDGIRLYSSRLDNVLENELVVAWPTDKGVQLPFDIDQPVSLYVLHDRGMYQLDSRIVDRASHPLPVLHVSRAGTWTKIQLRHNVRLDIAIAPSQATLIQPTIEFPRDIRPYFGAIRYAIALDEKRRAGGKLNGANGHALSGQVSNWDAMQADHIQVEPTTVLIRNLSAGGMLVVSENKIELGAILGVVFPLGSGQRNIDALSRVVWASEDGTGKLRYKAGCQFLNLETRQQDNITRFIFAKQSELRRSGLL